MAGFSNKKNNKNVKAKGTPSKPSPKAPKGAKKNAQKPQKNFSVDEEQIQPLASPKRDDIVSKNELNKMIEKVDIPKYIPSVKNCDEALFIHIINHSKTKDIDPFLIGKVDYSLSDIVDRCIKDSKKEFVPSDSVDLSDGNRIKNLAR